MTSARDLSSPEIAAAGKTINPNGKPFLDPGATAWQFLQNLEDHEANLPALMRITTPESWPAWGDFSAAAALCGPAQRLSLTLYESQPPREIAYVYLTEVPRAEATAVISLVHRPAIGGWRVHWLGEPVAVDKIPRDIRFRSSHR